MDIALDTVRVFIGVLILMTGIMKFAVPRLRTAWAGQLREAGLPSYRLTFWLFPVVEIVVGSMLIFDVAAGLAAVLVLFMMIGATYVHIVVHDPKVFPLQPNAPIVPLVVSGLSLYVLVGGMVA